MAPWSNTCFRIYVFCCILCLILCWYTITLSVHPHITAPNGRDVTPPQVSNCPQSFAVATEPGDTAALVTWREPTATDSESPPVTSTRSHTPGDIFPPGMTVVTYEFFDAAGNENTCTFIVTVTSKLTLLCCLVHYCFRGKCKLMCPNRSPITWWNKAHLWCNQGKPVAKCKIEFMALF